MDSKYRGRLSAIGALPRSQSEVAYDAIKQDILSCAIEPNKRLTEVELADRYGVGRASVRTALNRLYQEALVDVLPRYGYVVAGQDEIEPKDVYEVQLALEPAVARLAAGRVNRERLLELDRLCSRASAIRSMDDAKRFLHANTNFHAAVAYATGNALMARLVRILFERLERLIYASGRAEEVVRHVAHSHGTLIELLIDGRAADAEKAARDQVGHNHGIILAVVAGKAPPRPTAGGRRRR